MDASSLLIFAGALFVAAGSPGPNVAALVARVLARGWRDVLPFLAAMWIGEAIWLAFAVWGLAALAGTLHAALVALKYLGAADLAWLAWRMWTAPAEPHGEALPRERSAGKLFAAGMAVTLGNPKIMVFYLALLPTIVDLNRVAVAGWAELTATMLVVLAAVDLSWMALADRARALLRTPGAVVRGKSTNPERVLPASENCFMLPLDVVGQYAREFAGTANDDAHDRMAAGDMFALRPTSHDGGPDRGVVTEHRWRIPDQRASDVR